MIKTKRLILALSAGLLLAGVAASSGAYAEDAMKTPMHKHMKKHKGSMMKGGAMSKGDAMQKTDAPAQ